MVVNTVLLIFAIVFGILLVISAFTNAILLMILQKARSIINCGNLHSCYVKDE